MKVAVLLAEGFETIEALTTVDILRRAGVECHTFATKNQEVTTSHHITLKADKVFNEEIKDYDVVVLPGGMPGAVNLRDDERVINLLKEFNSKNKIIAAIASITFGEIASATPCATATKFPDATPLPAFAAPFIICAPRAAF